jgi:stress response protein YsnF
VCELCNVFGTPALRAGLHPTAASAVTVILKRKPRCGILQTRKKWSFPSPVKSCGEKRETSTGKVRVQTVVETVDELARANVEEDSLDVQRVPVGKVVTDPPGIRTEGDVTIIPVLKETMIVEKRLVLVEEVHIRRTTSSRVVEIPVTLRKQKAVIDSIPSERQTARQEDRKP